MNQQKYIPSIDGMRALAVLSVILFHGFPKIFPGGFIGVDIFFVISGYLITQIIATQAIANQFSFVDFYSRRIRRIFPSLILVFLVVYGLGWFVMLPGEYMQIGKHIFAGASFISNWVYWLEAGYFDELAELKPLLNLWSLGVEEQFYIIWPIIILVLVRLRLSLKKILTYLVCLSFLLNIFGVKLYPSATFYLPFARMWELGIGGLIAIYSPYQSNKIANDRLAFFGLALIFAPVFYLSPKSTFPGWAVVPPILGAALLLWTINADGFIAKYLSSKWIVFLGLVSYPLYLWHWPTLSFGRLIKGESLHAWETAALLIFSLIAATFSYLVIEKRIRYLGAKAVIALSLMMAAIGFQGWNTYHREGLEYRLTKNIQISAEQKRDFLKWEQKEMLPTGNCSPGFIYPEVHVCAQNNLSKAADIIVIGDSHAFSAYWGLSMVYGDRHSVRLIGQGGCLPFLDADLFGQFASCRENINKQIDWIAENSAVKVVFIFHRNRRLDSDEMRISFEQSANKTFSKLLRANKQVVYVYSLPELNFEPRLCVGELPFGRKNPVDSCTYLLDREAAEQAGYRSVLADVLRKYPSVGTYDPASFLCPNGFCNAVINNKVMFTDSNHLSESGSNMQSVAIKKKFPLN